MRFLMTAILLIASATTVFGQDEYLELLRSDIRAEKVAILTATMQFTDAEGEVFWPIYREYDVKQSEIGDRRIALIKDFAASYETMTDEKAKEIAKEFFSIGKDRLKLLESYYKKVEKAMNSSTAAKFVQAENQVRLLIDLQIAAEMPLIQRTTSTK
jgi:hypothetical protein